MLRLTDLTLARGTKTLLDRADLTVFPGHRVGLIGPNGCGKSSLFALIRGRLLPEGGQFEMPPGWVLAHVAQETPPSGRSALDWVLDGDAELRELETELERAALDASYPGERLAELHLRYEEIGGHAARSRAAALLDGLGFGPAEHGRAVREFSGGWRMRLNLAQALMCRSDLLLLDEPTNHLDLDAVLWLEDWLRGYRGTLLLITHDRDFLDAVVDTIVHVDHGKLKCYPGSFAAFEQLRAEQLAVQNAAREKQQRTVAHLEDFIRRFKAKATKAKQAQSRIKALERMERIAAAHVDSPFSFRFAEVPPGGRQLLRLADVRLGYGERTILDQVEFSLLEGQRIGLLGPNGAGKSTLVKAIAGVLEPQSGRRLEAQNLCIGYFAQQQVEQLRLDQSPLWHLQQLDPLAREQDLRNFLGGFDFRGDMASCTAEHFSGGEKARLTLALLVFQKPNLLLLDEPTNHLDLEMREALTEALQDYGGALVVVAHDRHLLRATADELWLVADGRVRPYEGDLDDYRRWSAEYRARQRDQSRTLAAGSEAVFDRKTRRRQEAEERQRLAQLRRPIERRIAVIERDLERHQAELAALDTWLASELAYAATEKARLESNLKRSAELREAVETLEVEWLERQGELEALG